MVLPIVVAVVRALADGWFPVGDSALLAIRAGDVATSHHPLLGSWTSASFALGTHVNNPGPLYFDLAAPFLWTVGRAFGIGAGVAVAVGSINIAAALGTAMVGKRIGGWRVERWMLLLVAAVTWAMGSELLFDIWQPHALLLPFCLLLALTIAVTGRDTRLLPVWIGVASLMVQTHVAYVYAVVALAITVVVALVIRARVDGGSWRDVARRLVPVRDLAWTAGVLAVAWIQPVWEQVFGSGEGNLQRLATNVGGGDLTVGGRTAVKIVAAVTTVPPAWTRFGFEDAVQSTPLTQTADGPRLFVPGLPDGAVAVLSLAVVVALLGALIVVLRQPAQGAARRAAIVAVVLLVVAVAGLSTQAVTLTGLGSHQVRWLFALAAYLHVTIVWGASEWVVDRWGRSPAVWWRAVDIGLLAIVAVLVVSNLPFHAHDLGPVADRAAAATLSRTFDDLSGFDPPEPVVYDVDNLRVFEPYSSAVMMRLEELGVEFRFVDEVMVRQFGEGRRASSDEAVHLRQYERSNALLYDGGGCVVSMRSGVDGDAEVLADQLISAAAADLASGTLSISSDGLPEDVRAVVEGARAGDRDAGFRVVADALLPVLVEEGRVTVTPAIAAAVEQHSLIVERVNSTLLLVATPASACDPD